MAQDARPGLLGRILLTPLRLATGWGRVPGRLGLAAVLMLVLLRLTIGWHFYTEGVDKRTDRNWDASRFFSAARGPLASHFQDLVWDWDGQIRLDLDSTKIRWSHFREGIKRHYGLDEAQRTQVDQTYLRAVAQLEWVLESNANDIEEYHLGRQRLDRMAGDPARDGVASLGEQRATIREEWQRQIAPVLVQIDRIWTNYEASANAVAQGSQRDVGYYPLGKPRNKVVDTTVINRVVPYFDMAIGLCLLLGLFTPVAALAAAGFLISVFLSQLPPQSGPSSTYYPLIEAVGCLVLAATGAGRFAGLDFFFHALVCRLWPATESNPEQRINSPGE